MSTLPHQFRAHQAEGYSGASARQLRYWDKTGLVVPSLQRTFGKPGVQRIYSRSDVVRLRAVVTLLQDGWTLQQLRADIDNHGLARPGECKLCISGQPAYRRYAHHLRSDPPALDVRAQVLWDAEAWTRESLRELYRKVPA